MNKILDILNLYNCQHSLDHDSYHLPLVDVLVPLGDPTIKRGLQELELLADAIWGALCDGVLGAHDDLRTMAMHDWLQERLYTNHEEHEIVLTVIGEIYAADLRITELEDTEVRLSREVALLLVRINELEAQLEVAELLYKATTR